MTLSTDNADIEASTTDENLADRTDDLSRLPHPA
jgi:hypothetical protein